MSRRSSIYTTVTVAVICSVIMSQHASYANFAETPSSTTIELGSAEHAMFRCRHQLIEAIIGWEVNGSRPTQFPDITKDSINENGTTLYTLTIPARADYNGTEVVCVAAFIDGSPPEFTPPAILHVLPTGTHDIQNISVSSPLPGQVRVTGDFIKGSTATGVLLIIYSRFSNSKIRYISTNSTQNVDIRVAGLSETEYEVSTFTLKNGLPFPRVVGLPKNISVNNGIKQDNIHQLTFIEYKFQPISNGVCITCTFLDSSTNDCVAVVHQRISQLSSSGLMNIESSHKFNRSGDSAYGCIEGVNLTDYQVGVIDGKRITPMTEPSDTAPKPLSPGCIEGIVLASVFAMAIVIAAIVVIVLYMMRMRMRKKPAPLHSEARDSLVTIQSIHPDAIVNNGNGSTAGNLYESPPSHVAITLEEHTETPKSPSHPPVPLRQGVVQDQLLPTSTPPTTLSSVYGEESNRTPPDPTYVDPSEASSNETPDDLYKTVYNEIQPHSKTQDEGSVSVGVQERSSSTTGRVIDGSREFPAHMNSSQEGQEYIPDSPKKRGGTASDHLEGESDPRSINGHQDVNKLTDANDRKEESCDQKNAYNISQSSDLHSHSPEIEDNFEGPVEKSSPSESVNSDDSVNVDIHDGFRSVPALPYSSSEQSEDHKHYYSSTFKERNSDDTDCTCEPGRMANDVELVPCSLTDHNYPLHMAMDKNYHELCQPSQANWESDLELTRRIECQESGDDKTDYTTAMIKQSKATVPGPGISASYFKQRSQVHELHVNRTLMESALSLPLLSVIQIQNSVLATISTH